MAECLVGIWPFGVTDEVRALLQPAAELAGEPIEEGVAWTTWTVHRGGEMIGAAQVRRTVDRSVDVVFVGGRDSKEWIGRLDRLIGEWAVAEGASKLTAQGRAGWVRVLTDWNVIERRGRWAAYERLL